MSVQLLRSLWKPKIRRLGMQCRYRKKLPRDCNVPEHPYVILNNGIKMPNLGMGTWMLKPDLAMRLVKEGVEMGYRAIDTAQVYQNEKAIGRAIQKLLKEKRCLDKREHLFITTKLWNTFHNPCSVETAISLSLADLQMPYVDLYLMHWPTGYEEGKHWFPRNACGQINFTDYDYVETWKAMEKLVCLGLTKSIGVANFNKKQLERILDCAKIPPAVLQIECHPYLNQKKLMEFCCKNQIAVTAYSPLGSSYDRPYSIKGEPRLLESVHIRRIAFVYGKSPAQLLIRYQIQRGNVVIPRATTTAQLKENIDVYDWEISDVHMKQLDAMNRNIRYVIKCEEFSKHKYFPFWDEY